MIEVTFVRENHIAKQFVGSQLLQVAGPYALDKFAIILAAAECAAADHCKLPLVNLNRQRKALQSRVASIVNHGAFIGRSFVRQSAKRITESHVFWRRLQRFTNRVVVRNDQRGRLVAFHQQQSEPGIFGDRLLHFGPTAWRSFRYFLFNGRQSREFLSGHWGLKSLALRRQYTWHRLQSVHSVIQSQTKVCATSFN